MKMGEQTERKREEKNCLKMEKCREKKYKSLANCMKHDELCNGCMGTNTSLPCTEYLTTTSLTTFRETDEEDHWDIFMDFIPYTDCESN